MRAPLFFLAPTPKHWGSEEVLPTNLSCQDAIKRLIEARFDAVSGADSITVPPPSSARDTSPNNRAVTNGTSDPGDSEQSASPEPARKKVKRSSSAEDADARLAAQLQEQENNLVRARKTRGGGDKARVKKKAPRKKSAKRVRADDDSDVDPSEDSVAAPPKRKAAGGFQKPFNLSETLSELCGETQVREGRHGEAAEAAVTPLCH